MSKKIAEIISAQHEYQTMSGEKEGGEIMVDKVNLIDALADYYESVKQEGCDCPSYGTEYPCHIWCATPFVREEFIHMAMGQ